ncbi:MAG: hypothetical protein JNK72_16145 [Myxococcales bacterium]|nr:hypothetical protein [Myxococcales bacterium]
MSYRSPRPERRALVLAALCAMGCKETRRSAPAQTPAGPTNQTARPAAPAVAPGRGAQVIVDISESIRGFTSAQSTALETLHAQVIESSLSALQVNNPFQRCTVDDQVRCGAAVTAQQLRLPATYRGANAALHLALRRPPRAPRPDLQQPDPLDPYAVTVMVTDGFQSTGNMFQPGASSDVACTSGADPSCLAALLRQRVDEGYGLWVGRLVMGFDGRYFAERRLDPTMWQRITAHINALNVAPEWNGVRFSASAPNMTGASGAFRFTGARPLLVFVLSRDIARGRGLVAEMERRLRVERITRRGIADDVVFSEWSPFEGMSAQLLNASRAASGGANDHVLVARPQRSPAALDVTARCDIEGKARIRLDGVLRNGALPPPPFAHIALGWRLLARPPQGNAGELLVPREALRPVPEPFVAHTGIDCTVLPAGTFAYTMGITARWTVDPTGFNAQWFARESAETSYEMPERVFGLADLARAVITAGVNREGTLDQLTLRVERR